MKLGLIVNPVAGIGGSVGLKGSDGEETQKLALERGGKFLSNEKAKTALKEVSDLKDEIEFITGPSKMGENVLKELSFNYKVIGEKKEKTTYEDTEFIARELKKEGVDLILFAGGDGTARNIFNAIEVSIPCIGIPAGVKIHSAVYANNPKDAGLMIRKFVEDPNSVTTTNSEVMDIDEEKFRQNILQAKLYGYLRVPRAENLMQSSKSVSASTAEEIDGIAEELENMMAENPEDMVYVVGTGGTVNAVMEDIGYEVSLLGVDIIYKGEIVLKEATESEIYDFIKDKKAKLIVTVIGGQGHVFGRGNQQLSPRIIRHIGKDNIIIVATHKKLYSIKDGVIKADTSDSKLDEELKGYWKILIGYNHTLVYKLD
ncbi:MAG: ATP-NAD kinase family protein [Lagierella massiliensis]|nr:ATP-NAD kinase family protein [Lagierella massiliensis]